MEIIQRRWLSRSRGAQPQPPTPSLLPSGYKRVSHLESVDGAYIDLNFPHRNYPSFKGSFKTTVNTPAEFNVFGMVAANTQARCRLHSSKTNTQGSNLVAYYAQYYAGVFYAKRDKWHTFELGYGYAIIDDTKKTMTKNFKESGHSHILFGYNNVGTKETSPIAIGDFQAFTGQDNPTIARDLIACYRESDGAGGYYDINGSICPLTGTPFYCNAGSGYFITGDEI